MRSIPSPKPGDRRQLRGAVGLAAMLVSSLIPIRAADPPGGIHLTVNKGGAPESVSLGWDTGAYAFSVYRSTSPGNVSDPVNRLGDTTSHSWIDTPPPGSLFFFVVNCANGACALQISYSCHCVDASGCGNGAPGGALNDLHTGVSASDVSGLYGPDRVGIRATGWACLVESTANICTCVGTESFCSCGNGALGGDCGDVVTGISTATVITSYGPDRIDDRATGWACRPSSVDGVLAVTYSCYCVDAFGCDNGAVAGTHPQIQSGISPSNVIVQYGPDRIGTHATGWACFPEVKNIVDCVGTSGFPFCGNGAPGGFAGDSAANVSTSNGLVIYGIGRIGSEATGWTAIPASP